MEQQLFPISAHHELMQPVAAPVMESCEPRSVDVRARVGQYRHTKYEAHQHSNYSHATSRLHEVFLIAVIACSILTLAALFQFNANDNHGWAFFLNRCFGGLSYLIPLYLIHMGVSFYRHWKDESNNGEVLVLKLLGASGLYLSLDAIIGSGKLGQAITQSFFDTTFHIEAWVIVLGLLFSSLFLMTNLSCISIGAFIKTIISRQVTRKAAFYPIDNGYQMDRSHYNEQRESNLITYQQPFSQPHIHDPQSNQLINCLAHFGIRAVVSNKIPGPVITRFELHLAPGTKSSAICSHHKEIARSLCVQEVRVIEVIAGKSCIGIEVPNTNREIFSFGELKDELENCREKLPLLLGRTITGESKVVDLHTMPHLLIAGSTRSGKTMLLQSILMSLTTQLPSQQLKISLIDPKQIAFSEWKNAPHLLHPVITDTNEAVEALNWCVIEMERRYELMSNGNYEKFPTLVIIVDEFADLIMAHKSAIEDAVKCLAQKARQSDIHLILSTQCPTADVITGHIKTNMPVRIALSVPERRDSRIILDEQGAETLLGQGDMLLKINGQPCERLHAPLVSDAEIREHVFKLISGNLNSVNENINDEILAQHSNITRINFKNNQRQQPRDLLYDQVVAFIRETKKASTTSIQNKFKIGYQKASGIIDRLEVEGIIGKRNKVNEPREVLVD